MGAFVLMLIFYISDGVFELDGQEVPVGLGSVGALPVGLLVWVIGLGLEELQDTQSIQLVI